MDRKLAKLQAITVSRSFLSFLISIILMMFVKHSPVYGADSVEAVDKRPEVSESRIDIEESKSVITDIMSKKPFVMIKQEKVWNFEKDKKQDPEINPDMGWLTELVSFITMMVEIVLWIIPVIVIFYLYRYRDYWLNIIQGKKSKNDNLELPETLFGLDIRQQSLPDDIQSEAHSLWQNSHHREAVSLLYRGSLASLFKQYRFELPAGATEHDCIRQLEINEVNLSGSLSEEKHTLRTNQFKKLTDIWVSVAYAHRIPEQTAFYDVCNSWNRYFSTNGLDE